MNVSLNNELLYSLVNVNLSMECGFVGLCIIIVLLRVVRHLDVSTTYLLSLPDKERLVLELQLQCRFVAERQCCR